MRPDYTNNRLRRPTTPKSQQPSAAGMIVPMAPEQFEHLVAKAVKDAIGGATQPTASEQPTDAVIPIAERLLRLTEACLIAGVSRHTIADLERAGDFPDRVWINENVFAYRGADVLAWRDARPNKRPSKPA